jgi:allophanate hydrolase
VPGAPTIYRIAEVEAEPLELNSRLGRYTNFVNLLDLAAITVPAGFRPDDLPFGVTLIGPAFSDRALAALGARFAGESEVPAAPKLVKLAVVGAHLSGMPLNHQLTERGAKLLRAARTAPFYRLYALNQQKPGLVREAQGASIEVEVWEIAAAAFGSFVAEIPAPLGIGTVELEDGEAVKGFLCEQYAVRGAQDISRYGGWRRYLGA